jgi:myo-inositol-1(or 4)-monophosphatase
VTDEELRELLRHAARAVCEAVVGLQRHGLSGQKATQYHADLAADRAAIEVLVGAGLQVVSEESGTTGDGSLVCVLDPIDGSTNFDRGIPYYATSLCVLDAGQPRCGLVVNLATDTWYEATRGGGATRDSTTISSSGVVALRSAIVSCGGAPTRNPGWAQFRALGAASLELCAVADGSLDGFVVLGSSRLNPWDYLAGMLIAEESGALVVEADGEELVVAGPAPRRVVAASTTELLEELEKFVASEPH